VTWCVTQIRRSDYPAHDLRVARLRQVAHEFDCLGLERFAKSIDHERRQPGGQVAVRRMPGPEHAEADERLSFHLVGYADRGSLEHSGMVDQYRFDLRRTKTFAGNLDRVRGAPEDVPKPVVIDRGPVTVYPDAGEARPVRLEVTLLIVPEPASHADPRCPDDQLADLIPHRAALVVDDIGGDPGRRAGKCRRLEGGARVARNRPPRPLGASRIINDRQTATANHLEEPSPRLGIPWFARRAEDAQ